MSTPNDAARLYRARLADAVSTIERLRNRLDELNRRSREPIAVVGTALRMPGGADTPEDFWLLLRHGVDTTREFPDPRGDARSLYHPDPDHPGTAYVTRGAFLDHVDGFDPAVFGISPREAVGIDPQQRLVLELAWEALERAGYAPTELTGSRTGVYVGVSTTDYVRMRQQSGDRADVDHYQLLGEPSFIAGRVSYTFGFRGPSQVIDTTCSSSLVAVHEASQALRAGECDMALAGGVNLMLSPYGFLLMSKFRALAADGRCKTFDASADGYARGEGAGLVVLERLSDALANRDTVLAVICGSAVNHDGRSSGMTVPNPQAQRDVITRALDQAGISPGEVDYVEAHGTGTSLGDPIELGSLDAVLGEGRDASQPLLVGSVKTNIGHLEPAAGIAGLLKLILALEHAEIPPHLNLVTPNPQIPWHRLRVDVPTSLRPWPRRGGRRLGAVSSFGASGTNAHVVVSAPDASVMASTPDATPPASPTTLPAARGTGADGPPARDSDLLVISARTPEALRDLAGRYADHLASPGHLLGDVCFTARVGRARLAHGLLIVGKHRRDFARGLASHARGEADSPALTVDLAPYQHRKTGWLFTGQGAQYPGMAAGLRDEPAFAEPFQACAELLDPLLPRPLAEVLWADARQLLDDTRYTQPALFAVGYALGRALQSWGLAPSALLGHSIGEITAACLAGVLDLPDAARLVAHRARLMAELPAGGVMAAADCDEATVLAAIGERADRVALAAVNGPADVVLSGAGEDVAAVRKRLAAAGYRAHPLNVSHAFHSSLLAPMLAEFSAFVDSLVMRPPRIPLLSNLTGRLWTADELHPGYWVRHATGTVRFHEALSGMYAHGVRTFVEVGPQPVLTGLGRRAIDDPACAWVGLLKRSRDDRATLLRGLGTLHLRGCQVDWHAMDGGVSRRVPGPTYPWQRERYWFRSAPVTSPAAGAPIPGLGSPVGGPDAVFEEAADAGQPVTTPPDALGWLVERSLRAAAAGLGGRWRRLADAELTPASVHEARGAWIIRSTVRPGDGGSAVVDIHGALPDAARAGGGWRPHGGVRLHRSAEPAGAGKPAIPSDLAVPVPEGRAAAVRPVEAPSPGPSDDAAAWGRVIQAAAAALAAVAEGSGRHEGSGRPDGNGWVHSFAEARCPAPGDVHHVHIADAEQDGEGLVADVALLDEAGRPLGEVRRLRHDPLPSPPTSQWCPEDTLVYRIAWVATADAARAPARGERVLLLGADPVLDALARALRDRSASCEVVRPGADPTQAEVDRWLDAEPTRIVVSGLAVPDGDELTAESLDTHLFPTEQLLVRLVQRMTARSWPDTPARLVLLTRGAAAVPDPGSGRREPVRSHAACNPAAATLWGLGRVVALEHPECWAGAIDLDPAGTDDVWATAGCVLDAGAEDQIALRGTRRLVPRLNPVPAHTLPAPTRDRVHRPGTVLVTGGLGGIGTAVAEWLARTGTERLVLAARQPLPSEDTWDDPGLPRDVHTRIATVRRLRDLGADVEVVPLDVTDAAAVTALVEELATGSLPLRGIVHAAGVSAPQDLAEVDAETYRRVWAPKTIGSWVLHDRTRHVDLDLFICFSSIAATWGSQHLASYAAANSFLDGLAHLRCGQGLPCLTVDWGPWDLPSNLFGDDVMSFLESVGLRRLHPPQCISLLQRLLRASDPQYVVCAVDWNRYRPVMEARTARPLLKEISVETDVAEERDQRLLDQLAGHAGEEAESRAARTSLLGEFLRGVVAGVLGASTASVAAEAEVFALGLDSLMVMEVAAACRRALGVAVPPSAFFSRSTLASWTDLLDHLLQDEASSMTDGAAGADDDSGDSSPAEGYATVTAISPHAVLAEDIHPVGAPSPEPDLIMLTGATGFVGAFLLDELLTATDARVACLVRCADGTDGLERLRRNVTKYLPWRGDADSRIMVVPGDLSRPGLGLTDVDADRLAAQVDAIYHAGAQVDFVHTFDQLAPANIGGTGEILRLAARGQPKSVNHISTYGIWGLPVPGRTRILETDDITTAGRLATGYVQTKWGAELLVQQARGRGLPVRTFRPGRVLGDSRTGVALTTHFTCRVIKGCIQLGLAPDLGDLAIEMTPVDYVVRALVHICHGGGGNGGGSGDDWVFHLVNPAHMAFADLVRFIQRSGWPVEVVDRNEWWEALCRSVDVDRNDLHPVMDIVREFVVGGEEAIDYDVACAEKALAGSGIECPPLDEQLLESYFDYFLRSGFLTK